MKKIVLYLFIISIFISKSFGIINDSILKVHATILPKVIFMDYDYKMKIQKDQVKLLCICEHKNLGDAKKLRKYILEKYKDGINGYHLEIIITTYDKIDHNVLIDNNTAIYLFPSSSKNINMITNNHSSLEKLVFTFDKIDLQYGADISVDIGNKIKPILNLFSIKNKNISLRPMLIDISNIYYHDKNGHK